MNIKRIGIIGLGTVGEAVLKSLIKYSSIISQRTSLKIEVRKTCDIDKSKRSIAGKLGFYFTKDPLELINDPQIDIIVELVGGIEPAKTFILESLKKGKDVVTANKALLATSGKEIFSLAERKNKCVGFEASVCGAIPIIKSISEGLIGCEVKTIYGILNGTTNYILYKMRKEQIDFNSALKETKERGLVERNSRLDIEGIDALHKLCILSYLCYGVWPSLKQVFTEGISRISLLDILYAEEMDYCIKLLAVAKKKEGQLDLRVHPTLVSLEHPLSHISLAYNAVYLNTLPAGELLFFGEGAGGVPTSSAVISDIVSIASGNKAFLRKESRIKIKNIKNVKSRYYIRFMAQDSPGVLADVSRILASFNISIASVSQKEQKEGKFVPVVIITHEAKEDSIRRAIIKIDSLKKVKKPSQIIRIEDL
jgi:homoserine dehydrogenase